MKRKNNDQTHSGKSRMALDKEMEEAGKTHKVIKTKQQKEKKEEEPFQKALSIMCPLSRFKGKTLGEVLREEPEVINYLALKGADKYKETHPEAVKAAKIICEYAKKKSKQAEEDAA